MESQSTEDGFETNMDEARTMTHEQLLKEYEKILAVNKTVQ